MICKLCHQKSERSSADRLMCGKCYAGLMKYKRLIVKDPATLPPGNLKHIEQFEAMIEHNQLNMGYVPRFYKEPLLDLVCQTCDVSFTSTTEDKFCHDCKKRENNFRSLIRRNIESPSFKVYFDYYKDKYAQGKSVPSAFIKVKDTFYKKETP